MKVAVQYWDWQCVSEFMIVGVITPAACLQNLIALPWHFAPQSRVLHGNSFRGPFLHISIFCSWRHASQRSWSNGAPLLLAWGWCSSSFTCLSGIKRSDSKAYAFAILFRWHFGTLRLKMQCFGIFLSEPRQSKS